MKKNISSPIIGTLRKAGTLSECKQCKHRQEGVMGPVCNRIGSFHHLEDLYIPSDNNWELRCIRFLSIV